MRTVLPPRPMISTSAVSDPVVRKWIDIRSRRQSPLGLKTVGDSPFGVYPSTRYSTRSITSGSRLSRCDQPKAATVATRSRPIVSGASHPRRVVPGPGAGGVIHLLPGRGRGRCRSPRSRRHRKKSPEMAASIGAVLSIPTALPTFPASA